MNRIIQFFRTLSAIFELWCYYGLALFFVAFFGPLIVLVGVFLATTPFQYLWMMFSAKTYHFWYLLAVFVFVTLYFAAKIYWSRFNDFEPEQEYLSNDEAQAIAEENLDCYQDSNVESGQKRSLLNSW